MTVPAVIPHRLSCARCDHHWVRRGKELPKVCPKCKRVDWRVDWRVAKVVSTVDEVIVPRVDRITYRMRRAKV